MLFTSLGVVHRIPASAFEGFLNHSFSRTSISSMMRFTSPYPNANPRLQPDGSSSSSQERERWAGKDGIEGESDIARFEPEM